MAGLVDAPLGVELVESLNSLTEDTSQELDRAHREITEINVLIKQTSSEVERANVRASEATSKLRELESHPDNFTRAEIREVYAAAQEAEMRLFLMKGQLELLEYKHRSLERFEAQLRRVVEVTTSVLNNLAADSQTAVSNESSQQVAEPTRTRDQIIRLKPADQGMGKIIDAQEDERQRIARRIHDGPAQDLANLILRAEICERLLINEPEVAKTELAGLKTTVVDTLREIRQFIFDLRPMILDDLGLIPTLRRYSESITKRTGTNVRLSLSGGETRLPASMEIGLFRISQEAIDNSLSHGKATEIQVTVEIADKLLRLSIEDNGTGFDVDKALSRAEAAGLYGLTGIRERALSFGGDISIESKPGQGTKLSVEVPLARTNSSTSTHPSPTRETTAG